MPKYTVTDPDSGKKLTLIGTSPPTEAELNNIFSTIYGKTDPAAMSPEQYAALGGGNVTPQPGRDIPKPERTWKNTVSDAAHAILPAVGGGLGGIAGGAAATPETLGLGTIPGAVAGGSLGYAGGEAAARTLDAAMGIAEPVTPGQAAIQTARDLGVGAIYGAGGPAAGGAKTLGGLIGRSALSGGISAVAAGRVNQAANYMMGKAAPETAGESFGNMGRDMATGAAFGAALPVVAAPKEAARAVGNSIADRAPGIYESAAKWTTTLKPAQRAALTKTLLDEKIPLNTEGYDKLMSSVGDINNRIAEKLKPFNGNTINAKDVVSRLDEARLKAQNTFDPAENIAAIDGVSQKFIDNWGDGSLTVGKAQEIKKDIYKMLKSHYDAVDKGTIGRYTDPEIAAMKNIGRGLKEEIEAAAGPNADIAQLNARESRLLKAEPHLRRAVGRIANHNILSLDDVLASTVGGVLGGPAGAAGFGAAKKILGQPGIKSSLAIKMDALRSKPDVPQAAASMLNTSESTPPETFPARAAGLSAAGQPENVIASAETANKANTLPSKQLWQMTKAEAGKTPGHKAAIIAALAYGETIPLKVLNEYPDLMSKAKPYTKKRGE